MLRISIVDSTHENVAMHLEGRLVGAWVAEVRTVCAPYLEGRRRLVLDLADVSFADAEGILLLQTLIRQHVTVIDASPFLDRQLQSDSGDLFPKGSTK